MLTIENIFALAGTHPITASAYYEAQQHVDASAPKPNRMSVWFHAEDPKAWELLMTNLTEVPVIVMGTRQVTGNGATDNLLKPAYAERLAEVNAKRAALGLERIFR